MAKLKDYRTTIGFHDAYVAAPSQKAALAAWGTEKNLFARGAAEPVQEPALMKAPLAHPGNVIKVSRGDLRDQLAALGPSPERTKATADKPIKAEPAKRPKKPRPRPSREPVDSAESALDAARKRHESEMAAIRKREVALDREKAAQQSRQDRELARLEAALARKRGDYAAALRKWHE